MSIRNWNVDEARKAGNPDFDLNSDWIDYAAAGATGPSDLFSVRPPVLEAVILSRDILDLGLRSSIDRSRETELAGRIVELRAALRNQLEQEGLSGLVVPFEPGAYNREATVGENLLFGAATGPTLADKALASNPYFSSVSEGGGSGPGALRYGAGNRGSGYRALQRPAARPSILPATGIHDGRGNTDLSIAAAKTEGPAATRPWPKRTGRRSLR